MTIANPVIVVTSCRADWANGRETAVIRTWADGCTIPVYIVNGGAMNSRVFSPARAYKFLQLHDCPDGYGTTSIKQQRAYQWLLANTQCSHVFQCDVDTYVIPDRLLMTTGWRHHHYLGRQDDPRGFCGGGAGYWLSRDALEVLRAAPTEADYGDLWVGRHLNAAGIKGVCDKRFWVEAYEAPRFPYDTDPDCWGSGVVSVHLGRGTRNYDPQWMADCHESYKTWQDYSR